MLMMLMNEFKTLCAAQKVIPVLALDGSETSFRICQALVEGGLRLLEITLRTPEAWDIARRVKREIPDSLVGIGTALTTADMERAAHSGFSFVVSPGTTDSMLECHRETGLPFLPGVSTPSEILKALEHGLDFLKFFPAEQCGGAARLKAYSSPFSGVTFCPTGGINACNAPEYLSLPNVCCVGGTWIVDRDAARAGRWSEIRNRAAGCGSL